MKILAVETATEACSAALYLGDEVIERHVIAPREHNSLLLPMLESLLAEAGIDLSQVDALAFGRGPGSFTGVRIAAGVAQGIALGAEVPVVPVSTLAALALEAFREVSDEYAFSSLDARMSEVYWGVFRRTAASMPMLVGEETVTAPDRVPIPDCAGGVGIGRGWDAWRECLQERLAGRVSQVLVERFPRASMIAQLGAEYFRLGLAVPPEQALPVYLRDNVAKKPKRALE
jgi:tRNA threonylcarbamoyladenosine biosynthesis protein TsaB